MHKNQVGVIMYSLKMLAAMSTYYKSSISLSVWKSTSLSTTCYGACHVSSWGCVMFRRLIWLTVCRTRYVIRPPVPADKPRVHCIHVLCFVRWDWETCTDIVARWLRKAFILWLRPLSHIQLAIFIISWTTPIPCLHHSITSQNMHQNVKKLSKY